MKDLGAAADRYAAMSNSGHAVWKGYPSPAKKNIERLIMFNLSQFKPLMLAALETMTQKEIVKLIKVIVAVSMRYSIIGGLGPGNIERAYSDAALQVRAGKANTSAKVSKLLAGIYPGDSRFKADFSDKGVVGNKPKLARYILAQLVNTVQSGQAIVVLEDETQVNLEHIMPKTPSAGWSNAATDETEYNANVHRIGNLTLLEEKANTVAGNTSFSEKKKKAYGKSDIEMTKGLTKYAKWDVSEIGIRQEALADLAAKIWRM